MAAKTMVSKSRLLFGLLVLLALTGKVVCRAVQPRDYESTEQSEDQEVVDELQSFIPVRDPTSSSSSSESTESPASIDLCATIFCGNGRKCVIENGHPTCGCALECPDHYKPICGTDSITYGNPCELHRASCLQNIKIRKHMHGPCPGPPPTPEPEVEDEKPLVCYEIERDQLRQLLIDWMKGRVQDDTIERPERSYAHVLTENFRDCDLDHDDQLSGSEFIQCVEKNETVFQFQGARPEHGHVLRGLCVDALILMSDTNEDWMLDLDEFLRCMDPNFEPPRKQCSLENKLFEDGAETRVDCNICVCACGNWVCSAMSCEEFEDYNLFEPYDVEQGPLPSKEERYALLRGFMAAEHINLDRVEEEVPARYEPAPYPGHEDFGGYAHGEDDFVGYNTEMANHEHHNAHTDIASPAEIPDTIPERIPERGLISAYDFTDDQWLGGSEEDEDVEEDVDEDYSDSRPMPELLTPGAKQVAIGGSPLVPPSEQQVPDSNKALPQVLEPEDDTGSSHRSQVQVEHPILKVMPQSNPHDIEHNPRHAHERPAEATPTQAHQSQGQQPVESTLEKVTPQPPATPAPIRRFIPVVSFNMTVVEHRVIHANDAENSDAMSVTAERIAEPSHGSHHGNHSNNHQLHNRKSHNKHHSSHGNHRSWGNHRDSPQPEHALPKTA